MKVLSRYLIRHNLFLLCTILAAGISLYLLADLFERLNDFLDAGLGLGMLVVYLAVKIPLIVSQILPAVFFLAVVLQLLLLERSRELTALNAGGVSPFALFRFFLIYSLIWAGGQLVFSQVLGVVGEQTASRIWEEDVRGRSRESASLKGLWFTEKNIVAHIGLCYPAQGKGEDIQVYKLDKTGIGINEIIKAKTFNVEDGRWLLANGETLVPAEYARTPFVTLALPIRQDLRAFQVVGGRTEKATQLPLGELSATIKHLKQAGSNVEVLRTIWHGKLAYAASIVVLGLLALVVVQLTNNMYKAVALALLIAFLYYSINTFGLSLGEKGIVPPPLGAWLANMLFCCVGLSYLFLPGLRRLFSSSRRFKTLASLAK